MKVLGFIKKKDFGIVKEEYLFDTPNPNCIYIQEDEKGRILNYLNKGERIFSITLSLFEDGDYIGPYTIFTDGDWVWPIHYAYYLKKFDFKNLNYDFCEYLRNKKFEGTPITSKVKSEATSFVELCLLNIRT